MTIYQFTMDNIQGEPVSLSDFKGKVVLIVNTASKCGYTPQFDGLQKLYEKYQSRGLVILGFPTNDFMHQDPGTNEEIDSFCKINYGVTFPMFSKITVKGNDVAPLYRFLTDKDLNGVEDSKVKWNFQKYLVSREGKYLQVFLTSVDPGNAELTSAIEAALEK